MVSRVTRWASPHGVDRVLAATSAGSGPFVTAPLSASANPLGVGATHRTWALSMLALAYSFSTTTGIAPQASISSGTSDRFVNDIAMPAAHRLYSSASCVGLRMPWLVAGNGSVT